MAGIAKTHNNLSFTTQNLEDGKLELAIDIPSDRFQVSIDKVYKRLAPSVDLKGFRPGNAPKNLVAAKLGPTLYEEAIKDLIPECTYEIITHEELTPLTQISYEIKKMAEGTGVSYTATFTVFPEFKLPDLKKIKIEKEKAVVTDDDVKKVVDQMFEDQKKKDEKIEKNDEWATKLNLGAKSILELNEKVKTELQKQKEIAAENKYITSILEEIAKLSGFSVPRVLIDSELDKREADYTQRIKSLGMKVEDFLRNQKTTLDDLKKNWLEEADKKIKVEIVLMKLAKDFGIVVSDADVEAEIAKIKDEKLKTNYQNEQTKNYIKAVLLQQKVITRLLQEIEGKKNK